jgi:hypothetical protein
MNIRRTDHIKNGGRVFIPQWRMRQIRWEEARLNSIAKREGLNGDLHHTSCTCGSIICLGAPFLSQSTRPEMRTESPVVKVVDLDSHKF